MIASVTLRLAGASDLPSVARLFHAIDRHYWGDKAPSLDRVTDHVARNVLQSGACEVLLAELSGRAVGLATFAVLYPAPDLGGQLFMKDLFVADEARSGGIGRALMRELARIALERGCIRFDWTAESDNPSAIHFYDALGAMRVTEKVYYRMTGSALRAMAGAEPAAV